jgi:hypothetical protein
MNSKTRTFDLRIFKIKTDSTHYKPEDSLSTSVGKTAIINFCGGDCNSVEEIYL